MNVDAVKELLRLTNPAVLEQVIYFSTASILDRQLRLLPEAEAHGTEYIQTKASCLGQLEQHALAGQRELAAAQLVRTGRWFGLDYPIDAFEPYLEAV